MREITQQECDYWFDVLADLLQDRPMYSTNGVRHDVTADEFMLMTVDGKGIVQFKHRHTRNYVFVQNGELIVPKTRQAFMGGFFDKMPCLPASLCEG